jgi:hypothetical protein
MLRRTKFNPKIADMLYKASPIATIGGGVLLMHHFSGFKAEKGPENAAQ